MDRDRYAYDDTNHLVPASTTEAIIDEIYNDVYW